eukprot:COSAG03_NODE_5968_length_1139_cov_3.908654_1_plen_44_part_10
MAARDAGLCMEAADAGSTYTNPLGTVYVQEFTRYQEVEGTDALP